ncbi:hypothetical protein DFJ58DRAFT_721095 [Suillus subalutaceus]|uniref:uncharacterized protein n=1 Tax=Suillus subalutaceus TaxID=48586 RepID=UPI001B85BC5C|nr:uncharacterized protein DFJ58DRAFT_721095 [Suillus subalutaceus]KAG1876629.1 hypothetical protein DFJ58DRAFT_721095 [Suillus subalutaceus]
MQRETLDGPKQSASNYWSAPSPLSLALMTTSSSTAITQEWLKDGGKDVTTTKPSTTFSNTSMNSFSLYPDVSKSVRNTSPASQTQPTIPPEDNMGLNTFYSLQHTFPARSKTPLSTQLPLSPPQSFAYSETGSTPLQQPSSSTIPSSINKPLNELEPARQKKTKSFSTPSQNNAATSRTRFNAPLASNHQLNPSLPSPQQYKTGLTPLPSPLRPHCLTRERLQKWTPSGGNACLASINSPNLTITDEQVD